MTMIPEVRDLALRLGASPSHVAGPVTLGQTGSMKLRLDSDRWFPFTATQTMQLSSCAFAWSARFWLFGVLRVVDALIAGEGRLDVTALGVFPLVRSRSSPALTKGETQRYLAELPYVPDAMLHNGALDWRRVDANRLAVATGSGEARSEVVFTLDPDGRIGSVRAEDRPRSVTSPVLPTPWQGEFSDYRLVEGRSVPFAAQVAWLIGGQRNRYWQGTLSAWRIAPPGLPLEPQRPGFVRQSDPVGKLPVHRG